MYRVISARENAGLLVRNAVFRGILPVVRTLRCVDCGMPATDYDHRDYLKPLDVDPVCKKCNKKRGTGENAALIVRKIKMKRPLADYAKWLEDARGRRERILRRYQETGSYARVAREFRLTRQRVHQIVNNEQ